MVHFVIIFHVCSWFPALCDQANPYIMFVLNETLLRIQPYFDNILVRIDLFNVLCSSVSTPKMLHSITYSMELNNVGGYVQLLAVSVQSWHCY